jgi:hypothetical protein
MTVALETLTRFDIELIQTSPTVASRLQPGLTHTEIEAQIASCSWSLPQDAFDLYQWHNGLSGKPGKLNLAEKLLRLKGKWHGELSGRENEVHLQLENRLIVVKFLPLNYALAGHRHLKLGRCLIDLLPFAILTDGGETIYCMMRLDTDKPTVYCANGTNLPPMKVTESFLSTQPQFSQLSDLIAFLTAVFQQAVQPISVNQGRLTDAIAITSKSFDCELNLTQFEQLYQQSKG